MSKSSATPRTDEAEYAIHTATNYGMGDEYAEQVVESDFARTLELELNAALKRIEALTQQQMTCRSSACGFAHGDTH